jgi:hypothetical protein
LRVFQDLRQQEKLVRATLSARAVRYIRAKRKESYDAGRLARREFNAMQWSCDVYVTDMLSQNWITKLTCSGRDHGISFELAMAMIALWRSQQRPIFAAKTIIQ